MVFGAGGGGQYVEVASQPHTDYLRSLARAVGTDIGDALASGSGTIDALL